MKLTIGKKMWLGFSANIVVINYFFGSMFRFIMTIMDSSDKYQFLLDDRVVKLNLIKEIEIAQKDTTQ